MVPRNNNFLPFAMSLLLFGCSVAPTQQEVADADYGTPQTPEQCIAAVESKVPYMMKDPSSVQWQHDGACSKGFWGSVPAAGLGIAYGYLQTGAINAKNSYGAYVGFASYQALVRDGRVIRYCVIDRNGMCFPKT